MKHFKPDLGHALSRFVLLAGCGFMLAFGPVEAARAQEKSAASSKAAAPTLDPSEFAIALDQEAKNNLFLSALAEHFPEVWASFRLKLIDQAKAGKTQAEINALAHDFGRQYMIQNTEHISTAPESALQEIIKFETILITKLAASNAQYCADFTMVGLKPDAVLSPELVAITGQIARARVVAIRKSMDKPVTRAAMTEDEWIEIFKLMLQLGLPTEILERAAELQTAKPETQCVWGVHLYQAMLAAPPELGTKAYAELFKSAAQVGN